MKKDDEVFNHRPFLLFGLLLGGNLWLSTLGRGLGSGSCAPVIAFPTFLRAISPKLYKSGRVASYRSGFFAIGYINCGNGRLYESGRGRRVG
jgi:hypothetical protein